MMEDIAEIYSHHLDMIPFFYTKNPWTSVRNLSPKMLTSPNCKEYILGVLQKYTASTWT